tara:strand:- start:5903 stop:6046 length:144 start_codon:yes stop_codon:yes gene_type:complete
MADYQLEHLAYEPNFESAKIAQEAVKKISAEKSEKKKICSWLYWTYQ